MKTDSRSAHLTVAVALAMMFTLISARPFQDRDSYAVLDIEGRGISIIEANSLTDRLRSYMVQTNVVTVVERGAMQQILQEQDFQLSGCTSDECAVEVGQLLGVTKMVSGSIGKFGETYTIDLKIVDVESGAIERSVIRDYRGELDGLLGEMNNVAHELVGLTAPPKAASASAGGGLSLGIIAIGAAILGGIGYYAITQGVLGDDPGPKVGTPPDAPVIP